LIFRAYCYIIFKPHARNHASSHRPTPPGPEGSNGKRKPVAPWPPWQGLFVSPVFSFSSDVGISSLARSCPCKHGAISLRSSINIAKHGINVLAWSFFAEKLPKLKIGTDGGMDAAVSTALAWSFFAEKTPQA